jgi:two-component system C4-dicarboxylate transport sensor histidine kinase DctB
MLSWSFELPMTEVIFVLLIVAASVFLSARLALRLTFIISLYVLAISYLQVIGDLRPDVKWLNQKLQMGDSVGFVVCLLIIGLISWLANRETDHSLERARRSEAALEAERDTLELKVIERTRQLEQSQMERVMELQRLAEFGRMSAGLLHDVADPLTVASLNLKELDSQSHSMLLGRALQSVEYIERFLSSARQQLKSQSNSVEFVIAAEIKQVLSILRHHAQQVSINFVVNAKKSYKLYGDPVKFNQILANLVLNAIEAYQDFETTKRTVKIELKQENTWIKLIVTDHGRGLAPDQIEHIFEAFYSTKSADRPNMGIGLATVKTIVEKDFKGRVEVTSSARTGTRFTIFLGDQASPA